MDGVIFYILQWCTLNSIFLSTESVEEILFVAQPQSSYNWEIYSVPGRSKSAWQESQNENELFTVCDASAIDEPENWLISDYIDRKDALLLYFTISMTFRECEKCKNAFYLYVLQTNKIIRSEEDTAAFILQFKEENIMEPISSEPMDSKSYYYWLEMNKQTSGLYLAIVDKGACGSLDTLSLHYRVCAEKHDRLTIFPRTPTSLSTPTVTVKGRCDGPSEYTALPVRHCNHGGEWDSESISECRCSPGYYLTAENKCFKCPQDQFKATVGNEECTPCPENSVTNWDSASYCTCKEGYYRADDETPEIPCATAPSKPRDINYSVEFTSVTIRWQPPLDFGGRTSVYYMLSCDQCDSRTIEYSTNYLRIIEPQISIWGLKPLHYYAFTISAINSVTDLAIQDHADVYNSVNVFLTTKTELQVNNVKLFVKSPTSILLRWDFEQGSNLGRYTFVVNVKKDGNYYGLYGVNTTGFKLQELDVGHYEFKVAVAVRSVTKKKSYRFSEPLYAQLSGRESSPLASTESFLLILIVVGLVLFALMVVLFSALCLLQRRHRQWLKMPEANFADYHRPYNCEANIYSSPRQHFGKNQTFIEPVYYNLDEMLPAFTLEINPSMIEVQPEHMSSDGRFADYALYKVSQQFSEEVCLKLAPINDGLEKEQLLMEAAIMSQFNHPNVLRLFGVSFMKDPLMLIMEHVSGGVLLELLRTSEPMSPPRQVHMVRGIACGMHYLAETGYIHKTLSSSYIYASSTGLCKIAGFDARIQLDHETGVFGEQPTSASLLRHQPPEVFSLQKFSSFSDVWSFGILLWEVATCGDIPYRELNNIEVMKAVEGGYRLPCPTNCPVVLYQLMVQCWQSDRKSRPQFSHIKGRLEDIIRDQSCLKAPTTVYNKNLSVSSMHSQEVYISDILRSSKLLKYESLFHQAGIQTVKDIPSALTDSWLQTIGIYNHKHRKRLLAGLQKHSAEEC